eukprot:GFUD01019162.1.p1 GENE.GFUD01019162.1~~GFUD01019162.1.p1  ORF type:complete len:937 (+),score=214.05 GFUD01019162.1:985-3795(+)
MVGNMVSIAESPMQESTFWWRPKNGLHPGLLPCELVELSPSLPRKRLQNGGSGTFHQIIRPRRGSMQSEAFSEPVFQKQGKLITFFRGFILPRASKRKKKVFQIDLGEYLFNLGIEVPRVVTVCSQFIELRGIVDGVYRLSGISSNIQRLRRSFDDDKTPDLFNDRLVLQDIHSVSSLLKLYFRELPAPVCTFDLYDQFVSAVQASEDVRLYQLRDVIAQLPDANYSTLEYLMKHLHRVSLHHQDTGMTARNLAIVWAPNLLRCQSLEAGGVEALQGVAVQAVVTEYLIKYCYLIFNENSPYSENTPRSVAKGQQQSFPISSPMKLLTLEEAQRQAQTINRRNQITPLESMSVPYRKKIKPWKKKGIFAIRERKEDASSPDDRSAGIIGCPCIGDPSKMSTTPGSTYWEPHESAGNVETNEHPDSQFRYHASDSDHPVQFDVDMDASMETKTIPIPNKKGTVMSTPVMSSPGMNSPVIYRCTRQGDQSMMDLSFREKRSSLRDKFRKFALSPIASNSHSFSDKMGNSEDSADCEDHMRGRHINSNVKRLDLHRNDSLEFIDASSSEGSEFEMSPSPKRNKFHDPVQESNERSPSDIVLNYATQMSIKEESKKKVETKLLECKHDNTNTNLKVTLDITSENNDSKKLAIKSFKKENEATKLSENNKHAKENAQNDAASATDKPVSCKETEMGSGLDALPPKVMGKDEPHGEQEARTRSKSMEISLRREGEERMERYKEERRHFLRDKYRAEKYLNPVQRAVKIRSAMSSEKTTETKTTSALKQEFLSSRVEIVASDDNEVVDNQKDLKSIRRNSNEDKSLRSISRHSSDPSDPRTQPPDTQVSTHKVVLRLSHSCPVQGQTASSEHISSKANITEEKRADDTVNVKERASVFEPKKKELKIKPNMTFNLPPQQTKTTSVPPSPSKIKSMAAIFEQSH